MIDTDNEESGWREHSEWLSRQIERNIAELAILRIEHSRLLDALGWNSRDSTPAVESSRLPGAATSEGSHADWKMHFDSYLQALSALPYEKIDENFARLTRLFHGALPSQRQAIDELLDPETTNVPSKPIPSGVSSEHVDRLDQLVDDETLCPIACGGQGFVLRVRHRHLNQLVVLKLLRTDTATHVQLEGFRKEAEILARLDDDEFMRVLAFGRFRGYKAIMVRWIDAPTLEDVLDDPRWTPRHSAVVMAGLARIVAKAHKIGVIHRDLKPANIFVQLPGSQTIPFAPVESELQGPRQVSIPLMAEASTGDFQGTPEPFPEEFATLPHLFATIDHRRHAAAKYAEHLFATPVATWRLCISDFGLAIDLSDPEITRLTQPGGFKGTVEYMSPEQFSSPLNATGQSDLWSLAVIFYRMLVKQSPFYVANNPVETINRINHLELGNWRWIRPRIPRDLDTITHKCLEKLPTNRYGTVLDLADELGRWLSGHPIEAKPPGLTVRLLKTMQRHPRISISAASGLLLLLGIVVVFSVVLSVEKRHTEKQKERAERSEILVTQHRDALLADLGTNLRRLRIMKRYPGLARIRQDLVADVRNRLDQMQLLDEIDQPVTLLRVKTLLEVGSIEYETDRPERAHAYWNEAEKELNFLETTEDARRTRTVLQCLRGDLCLVSEDLAQAEHVFTAAVEERSILYEQTRLESDWKLLARALRGQGESRSRSGNAKGAIEPFEKALTICRELHASKEDDASLRDLSVALTGRGDAARKTHDPALAKQLFLEARKVDRRRIENDVHNVDAVEALSVNCNRLGDLAEDERDLGTATAWQTLSLEADLTLRQMEPSVPTRYRHLLVSRQRMLVLSLKRGDWTGAEQHAIEGARTAGEVLRLPGPSDVSRQAAVFANYWLGLSQRYHGDLDLARKTLTESDHAFQNLLTSQIVAEIRHNVTRTNLLNSLELVGVELELNNLAAANQWSLKFDVQFAGASPVEKKEWEGLAQRAARLQEIIAVAQKGLKRETLRDLPVELAVPLYCLHWNELNGNRDIAGMHQVLSDLRTMTLVVPEQLGLVARVHARAALVLRGGRKLPELSMEERQEFQQLVGNIVDCLRAAVLADPQSLGALVLHSDFDVVRTTPEFMQWWEQHSQRFKIPLAKIDP
ncbi:MAG TPA: protein kinase [Gemmataceae bacterium]|jgi:serine/threonine protein kinase|nr:protein kinase [Gemmataceae bacterium]